MFGHQQGLGVREIENLPGGMVGDHSLVEGAAAAGTGLGQMIDGGIGGGGLAQCLAGMARLSAGLLAGFLTQAGDADRLLQPITGGGLPLLALFRPSRCSNLAMRACRMANAAA